MDPSRGSQPAREDSRAGNTRRAHLPDLFGLEYSESAPSLYKSKPTEVLVLEVDEDSDEEMDEVRVQAAVEPGSWEGAEEEQEELAKLDVELASVDEQIASLQRLRSTLQSDRSTLVRRINARRNAAASAPAAAKPQAPAKGAVDYTKSDFSWSKEVKEAAKRVWGIKSFRFCQEAAINACMDGRDVVSVLPTGGGKSLIYQLPAILAKGTTIVISPLISLMDDQVSNLQAKGVVAEQIHGASTQPEINSILKRMEGKIPNEASPKLVYVTPERLDKSKNFIASLQRMHDSGLLKRFCVDEAHCVSTLGHDYRTAYLALRRLKSLFPSVPILATTATAPSSVIAEMLKALALPLKTSPGGAALPNTTVLFQSPLYRFNLLYDVRPKPQAAKDQTRAIIDYIEEHHDGHTGIIYCLTRADAENCTKAIREGSTLIKAATYHAQLDNSERARVQDLWRRKKIHCVVATNASFGLGIDNPSVRYVIHASLPKSLSNFYQESGRAGRDGLDSDCVLFYRAADASRISTLTYETYHGGGKEKLFEMIQFCEDFASCRKVAFGRSFASKDESFLAEGDEAPCGHCDNCLRDPSTVESIDVSLEAYRSLRIISAAGQLHATLTLPQACDLVRGLGKGSFATQNGSKGKGKDSVDVIKEAGAKVGLEKPLTEALLIRLLCDGYLQETFHATAYSIFSYLVVTGRATRFTRLSPTQVEADGVPIQLLMDVLASTKGKGKGKKRKAEPGKKAPVKKKQKQVEAIEIDDDVDDDELEEEGFYFAEEEGDGDGAGDVDAEEALLASGMMEEDGFEVWR